MKYKISIADAANHFIKVEGIIEQAEEQILQLQLPAWRPGRYELQNYAKNVRCFAITDAKGNNVPFKKISKDLWEIRLAAYDLPLVFSYEYYANQYDAGASYTDDKLLYINPINCLMYIVGKAAETFEIALDVPNDYKIASQLPLKNKMLCAKSFDELADSPFIASPSLQHSTFNIQNSTFHFWFQGKHHIDTEQLKTDTVLYAEEQIEIFGEIPCKDYHFLYHILDRPFRHGVEHADSTVIVMGQGPDETDDEFYDSLLAISCHELFHLWNIKRIRPAEMWPYDFTKENYSTLGYVYEGITTYYGDIILLRSGAWTWEQYFTSFNPDLAKHLNNPGRFNYSVAESSFDTWLDGYVSGIPARKVSIYTEGMLAAMIADIRIIKNSSGKYSLDDVMRELYHEFYKKGKPYTERDYKTLLEKYAGISFAKYFDEVIWGKGFIEKYLYESLKIIGCNILHSRIVKNDGENNYFKTWSER